MNTSFLDSKTMQLICLGLFMIFAMVALGIAAKVIWGVDAFSVVGLGIGGVTAHTGAGVARNVAVDGPVRQQYAQQDTGAPPPSVQKVIGPPPPPPPAAGGG